MASDPSQDDQKGGGNGGWNVPAPKTQMIVFHGEDDWGENMLKEANSWFADQDKDVIIRKIEPRITKGNQYYYLVYITYTTGIKGGGGLNIPAYKTKIKTFGSEEDWGEKAKDKLNKWLSKSGNNLKVEEIWNIVEVSNNNSLVYFNFVAYTNDNQ